MGRASPSSGMLYLFIFVVRGTKAFFCFLVKVPPAFPAAVVLDILTEREKAGNSFLCPWGA